MHSFLWHDYETFGVSPRSDRPAQFAAIRTDSELNETGEPLMLYCRPAADYLPDAQACLITGITPQVCLERGLAESRFAAEIERAFSQPNTIGVGYNSIRFDDEVTRFLFWRNLIDPYAREWQNGCGRWDILDLARTAHALRPEGIVWPTDDDGRPSFRLEKLTAANGIGHDAAHDALSDVRATIGLARLIRQRQPRLFDYCLGLRDKARVADEIGLQRAPELRTPFLHVSGMFAAERGCIALMLPLAQHPTNKNEIIAWDLSADPEQLLSLDAETIRQRLFTKADELPDEVSRLPVKTIHLNRAPVVIGNLRTLSPAMAERWGLAVEAAQQRSAIAARPAFAAKMASLWPEVYRRPEGDTAADVDQDLYGGFLGNADRRQLNRLRTLAPEVLAAAKPAFDDRRLDELLFRYRARNFPHTLSGDEAERWREHCAARLDEGADGARSRAALLAQIEQLQPAADARGQAALAALRDYADEVALGVMPK
ncbi:MAG: sbcB [Burkholderiaceae bacterium]|nr:sbcB [Burkholderiaceae bacterium]